MNMCSVLLRNELPARTYTTPAEELAVSCIDGSRACSRGRKNLLRRNSREALRHCLAFGLAVLFCCVPVMAQTPPGTPPGTKPQNPCDKPDKGLTDRSEEHTSELQSRLHLVCRLLLEKKKKITIQSRRHRTS